MLVTHEASLLHGVRRNQKMDRLWAPTQYDTNAANAWDKWDKARFNNNHTAAELGKKPRGVHVTIIIELAGPQSLEISKTFTFAEGEEQDDMELVINKFREYCMPRRTTVYARYTCNTRRCETYNAVY